MSFNPCTLVLFPNPTEPSLYFGEPEYVVEESSGYVEVKVWRTGTDLSKTATVTVRSRKSEPVSAEGTISWKKHCSVMILHYSVSSWFPL